MAAAVVRPMSAPSVSRNAPPEKPSCIGAVVRITWSIARRRPVGSGPPMTATTPALAVTALLHDRATARARCPTRAGAADGVERRSGQPGHAAARPGWWPGPTRRASPRACRRRASAPAARLRGPPRAWWSRRCRRRRRGRWRAGGVHGPARPTARRPPPRRPVWFENLSQHAAIVRAMLRRLTSPTWAGRQVGRWAGGQARAGLKTASQRSAALPAHPSYLPTCLPAYLPQSPVHHHRGHGVEEVAQERGDVGRQVRIVERLAHQLHPAVARLAGRWGRARGACAGADGRAARCSACGPPNRPTRKSRSRSSAAARSALGYIGPRMSSVGNLAVEQGDEAVEPVLADGGVNL